MKYIIYLTVSVVFLSIVPLHSQVFEDWASYYASGLLPGSDYTTAIATDGNGNVFVTGISQNRLSTDYLTIKYDPAGNTIWENRYNPNFKANNKVIDMVIDNSGNAYITGTTYANDDSRAITIKYSASGEQEWIASYEKLGVVAMAADNSGNIYLTGVSAGLVQDADIVTIKYDNSGNQEWVSRYNDPGNSWEETVDIATDPSGNIFITGWRGFGNNQDFLTIKYNTFGDSQWVAIYNSPWNRADKATALAVDLDGNLYITGNSSTINSSDYLTLKYNSAGNLLWTARYDSPENNNGKPTAITVDANGNAYVTGMSGSPSRLTTLKYSTDGDSLWVARVNDVYVFSVAGIGVDNSGNVTVAGSGSKTLIPLPINVNYFVFKYTTFGDSLWRAEYDGPGNKGEDIAQAIALDQAGNALVTGYSGHEGCTSNDCIPDYTTLKYHATSGNTLWEARYDGPGTSDDRLADMNLDVAGNVYVTGQSRSSDTTSEYATVRFNTSGDSVWAVRFDGGGNDNQARSIVLDVFGNVNVTGTSDGAGTGLDYSTVQYDANGNLLWSASYDAAGLDDIPVAIASDSLGNIYVSGVSKNTADNFDIATIKYSPFGDSLWVRRYDNPEAVDDWVEAFILGPSQNIFIGGSSFGSSINILKYAASGEIQWMREFDYGDFFDMAIDLSENVYISSFRWDTQYTIRKYNTLGDSLWIVSDSTVSPHLIIVDANENIYVTGTVDGLNNDFDIMTARYDAMGNRLWTARYDGLNDYDLAAGITHDPEGNVYITGYSFQSVSGWITVKYNSSGNLVWETFYKGTYQRPTNISLDESGNVYVAGTTSATPHFYTVIKYVQTPTGVEEETNNTLKFYLSQNYPNPFNPSTSLRYSLNQTAQITLKIYNVLGQEIKTLVNEEQTPGFKEVNWDGTNNNGAKVASGIYIYRLEAKPLSGSGKAFVQSRKMVLLK
jgi:uncharacterized delta-60 repeat protein